MYFPSARKRAAYLSDQTEVRVRMEVDRVQGRELWAGRRHSLGALRVVLPASRMCPPWLNVARY